MKMTIKRSTNERIILDGTPEEIREAIAGALPDMTIPRLPGGR